MRSINKMKTIHKPNANTVGPLTDLKQMSADMRAMQDRTYNYYRRYLDTLDIMKKSE